MKLSEIKELTPQELVTRRRELRHEQFNLRMQQASGQLERPHLLRDLRKEIARIETVLTAKTQTSAEQ